jgi:Zn finger protein HypA/HybF involved in hydrogenase expression
MSKKLMGYCKECDQEVEALRVPDGPDFCPDCRSVDSIIFKDDDDEEKTYPEIIGSVSDIILGIR